jgi:hypothetical protein
VRRPVRRESGSRPDPSSTRHYPATVSTIVCIVQYSTGGSGAVVYGHRRDRPPIESHRKGLVRRFTNMK